jgi:hypothetical protein
VAEKLSKSDFKHSNGLFLKKKPVFILICGEAGNINQGTVTVCYRTFLMVVKQCPTAPTG